MEHDILKSIFEPAAVVIDIAATVILLIGFAVAVLGFLRWQMAMLTGNTSLGTARQVRCILGTYILIGLEFMIISDIIQTVISHSRDDLIFLAVIVALRTAIGYFLGKELEQLQKE